MRKLTHFEITTIAGGTLHQAPSLGVGFIDTNFLQLAKAKAWKDAYIVGGIASALTGAAVYGIAIAGELDSQASAVLGGVAAFIMAPYAGAYGFLNSKVWTNPLA